MLGRLFICTCHSFIKQMFITSLFCSKTLGYAKVSSFELRAASILTILSIGKRQCVFKKYLQLIYLMFPCLNLERNDHSFSDSKEKEGPRNKLVYCYEGWVLTMCRTLCCRALHCCSSISSWPFFALPFDPDSRSTRFTENQLCGATKPHTMDTRQIGQ